MTTVLRFGGYQSAASVHTRAAEVFGRELRAELGERIEFDFAADIVADGFKAKDLLRRVEDGRLSMCYFSASYLADRVPEMALLDLPFVFSDRDHAYGVLDGPLKAYLRGRLSEATGYRLMDFWDNGFRHFSNARHPIRTPEDCRGLTIRTLFSDLHGEVFRHLGFEPRPLDVKDLLDGVKSGSVTAQENPLTNTYNFGLHLHHRYITLSSHFFGAAALLCHAETYASWPDDVRRAVDQATQTATAAQRRFASAEDAEMLTKLAQTDVEIVELSATERARFVEAVQPVIDAQRARFGDHLFSLVGAEKVHG